LRTNLAFRCKHTLAVELSTIENGLDRG
jgi:hypothetical protein